MKRQTKKMLCLDWEAVKINKISQAIFGDSSSQYTSLYVLCFGAPPYQEKFTHDDVMKLAKEKWFTPDSSVLALVDVSTEQIYSYLVAYGVKHEENVFNAVKDNVDNAQDCLYVAEILTAPEWRGNGFAACLVNKLKEEYPDTDMIVRTTEKNVASKNLFLKSGFSLLEGTKEYVSQARLGDAPMRDKRIFMVRRSLHKGNIS